MSKKATHDGSCQLCGRQQKLPGGRLSQHGYTVQWGFFNGVCPGSEHLPFEQSYDLIQQYRDSSARIAADNRKLAAQLRAGKADDQLEASRYYSYSDPKRPASLKKGGYRREMVSLEVEHVVKPDFEYDKVWKVWRDGERTDDRSYNLQEALEQLREENAKACERAAENHEQYVEWQDKRIANWKPASLKPVAPEPKPVHEEIVKGQRFSKYDDVWVVAGLDVAYGGYSGRARTVVRAYRERVGDPKKCHTFRPQDVRGCFLD